MPVRTAADADVEAIAAVQVAAWRVAYAGIMPAAFLAGLDPAEVARARRELPPQANMLVAESPAGDVRGFCVFSAHEVHAIYVDPAHTGEGHGRALLAAAREAIGGAFVAWVAERNHPARRFFERSGLAADGERSVLGVGGADVPLVRYRHEEQQRDADPHVQVAADEPDRP